MNTKAWTKWRDIPIAILAWVALCIIIAWLIQFVAGAIIMVLLAGLLSYTLYPAVHFLQRFFPRVLAILIAYLVILTGIVALAYFAISTAVTELTYLAHHQAPLLTELKHLGITEQQIGTISQQVTLQVQRITNSIVPFLSGIIGFVLDIFIVAILSIYILLDGVRIKYWIRRNAPTALRLHIDFWLSTLERIVGGYIRGQLLLALIISVMVAVGLSIFHVPYAILLGMLTFLLEFIPVLGTFVSGAICVLLALSQGWLVAIVVLVYFVILHVVEGDVLGPRIVGKAIGLHPVVSIFALLAGLELFGIIGALFAVPAAGVLQAILVAIWTDWRRTHPEEFRKEHTVPSRHNS